MTVYFRAVLLYLISAAATMLWVHEDRGQILLVMAAVSAGFVKIVSRTAIKVLPIALPLFWWFGRKLSLQRLSDVFTVAVAATMVQIGFMFFKSSIPQIIPFYSDPFWAWLDQQLLFGHDAWELAHALTPNMLAASFSFIYLIFWSALAYCFPILVVASDVDDLRMLRYIWLYFLSWIIVGNLLATLASSVGPVFYDQLLGTNRFDSMRAAFAASHFSSTPIGELQALLWDRSQGTMSFISAFPSMHLAIATIAAIYLRERFRRLRFIGDGFVALILLISVYSGFHYLVDGLASIGIVLILNATIRRQIERSSNGQVGA